MLTLRDLMTPDPQTVDPGMTLREAVERLADIGVSGAPVVTGERLVGVISTSDIVAFESTTSGVPAHREQQEWGEWGPSERLEEDFTEPAAGFFRDMWADSGADVLERVRESDGPEWDFLSEHVVGEVMTRQVLSLSPEADVAEAARLMVQRGVHRLLVTEGEALVGVVSTMDFVRAVAENKLAPTK